MTDTDGDTIAHVAVVILLLGLAVPTLATAYDYSGTPTPYSDEAVVDYQNKTTVSANATLEGYGERPVIVANGTTLTLGEDYVWNASSGTVTWLDTANTSDGDPAVIEYEAYQRTGETEAAWTILAPLMGLFGVFGFVAAVRALLSYVEEVWTLS